MPAVCFAQSPDSNQKLLDEIKAVRASLDRLAPLVEAIEKNQRALLALQQIQVYDSQLRALDAQRDTLAEPETDLGSKVPLLSSSARAWEAGIGPTPPRRHPRQATGGRSGDYRAAQAIAALEKALEQITAK